MSQSDTLFRRLSATAGWSVWRATAGALKSDIGRAKYGSKGLGPVQQNPVNPARSGRKQR